MPSQTQTCYALSNNTYHTTSYYGPCFSTNSSSPNAWCCETGHTCLETGFCQYSNAQAGGSGYYLGGCTDKTFVDVNCPSVCEDQPLQDAVYDYNASVWFCCGLSSAGALSCNAPKGVNFSSPAPANLNKIASIVNPTSFSAIGGAAATTTTGSSLSKTATGTTKPTNTGVNVGPVTGTGTRSATGSATTGSNGATSPPIPSPSQSLSGGAIAGIVVGVIAILALIAGIVAFLLMRRKRQQKKENTISVVSTNPTYYPVGSQQVEAKTYYGGPQELPSEAQQPAELGHSFSTNKPRAVTELPADDLPDAHGWGMSEMSTPQPGHLR